jgi:transcriptional regulator with XRE-family HTH domain
MQIPLIGALKARREALGRSVADAAHCCALDEAMMRDWEAGIGSPPLDTAQKWAASLGLTLALTGDRQPPRRGVSIDWNKRQIAVDGAPVRLTAMEWKALEKLAHIPGDLVTHEALFRHLYGEDQPYRPESTAIRVLITKLRRLLPLRIEARWGRGYVLSGIEPPPDARQSEWAGEAPRRSEPRPDPMQRQPRPEMVRADLAPAGRDRTRQADAAPPEPAREVSLRDLGPRLGPAPHQDYRSVVRPVPRVTPAAVQPARRRAEELDVIERFHAERGATRCPEIATIQRAPLPTLIWDKNKRKWVRPPTVEIG